MKLNAKQLRSLEENPHMTPLVRKPLYLILDNVYDTYNIGGLFRLADALAIQKLYICGTSATPPDHKIKKASIGTYKIVPWEYKKTTLEAIQKLRRSDETKKVQIVAVEQTKNSIPYTEHSYVFPLALVVGNETSGISKDVLKACDSVVEIPMLGINTSLNVIVSAAIVGYHSMGQVFHSPSHLINKRG